MNFAISSLTVPHLSGHKAVTAAKNERVSIFKTFAAWCEKQEQNRFMWLVMSFLAQIGMALPCTLFSILFMGGNNFNLWLIACVVNVPVLALNLAAQSTKITIPFLMTAWTVDAIIIIYCAAHFLMAA